jgi:cerevisin
MLVANDLIHEYNLGYAARLDDETVDRIREMPEVDFIEANQMVWTMDHQQNPANWGLDRICRRDLPLGDDFIYPPGAGEGVDVYVIDTGINIRHKDFEGEQHFPHRIHYITFTLLIHV